VCLKEAAEPAFRDYQARVVKNAAALARALAARGFRIITGGTDNHLFLLDVGSRGTTGTAAQTALENAGMTVNKNAIPFDPLPPMKASGIRIGSPAVTTRGMGEAEMERIAGWIAEVLANANDATTQTRVKAEVAAMAARFPLYPKRLATAEQRGAERMPAGATAD